jgi:hypothetical protein
MVTPMNNDHAPPADFELLKLVAQHFAENAAYRNMGNSATIDARSAAAGRRFHLQRLEQRITMTSARTLDGVIAKARCVSGNDPVSPLVASLVRDILSLNGSSSATLLSQSRGEVMTVSELKAQMRLHAIELLAANLFAMTCLMTPKPRALISAVRQQMIGWAQTLTFPGFDDPAMSDLCVAELESAVDRVVEVADEQINRVLRTREIKRGHGSAESTAA